MIPNAALIAEYWNSEPDLADIKYFTLQASPPEVGTIGLDSSDQDVLCLDSVSGVVAYRNGLVLVDSCNEVTHCSISDVRVLSVLPTLPIESSLRLKLSMEQMRRFRTGFRPSYSPLQKPDSLIRPRLVGAAEREMEDYCNTCLLLNSVYIRPGHLFMRDGRLNAQDFPGPRAYDLLYRLMAARFVRGVGVAKSGKVLDIVRPYARAVRKKVGDHPFAFPILQEHLETAYTGPRSSPGLRKTLRHGASSQSVGGVGAIRFSLSISGDELCLVEFNLYDLEHFRPLIACGCSLEQWSEKKFGSEKQAIYSWDLFPFVTQRDWEQLFIPTLQEIVYAAYTDTEIGMYPRALANVHNRVKLRLADLETTRRQVVVELGLHGVTPEMIPIAAEDPHKWDPEVYNQN